MSMVKPRPMPPFPKPAKAAKKPRRWLRHRSAKKRCWHEIYVIAAAFLMRLDPICRRCRRRRAIEGHHPFGQAGALILIFWPFCRVCHDEVHFHPNKAREDGWLY
jgi:hypothetical protein